MQAHQADTERKEITETEQNIASNGTPPAEAKADITPGRPLAFKDALAASMAKFDAALHRLAK